MKKSGTKLSTRPKSTTHNLQEISQLWKVTEAAWHERNQALHNGQNKLTSQSEYNEKMKKYYQHKGEILRRDEHLFSTTPEDLLKSKLGKNQVFGKSQIFI